MKLSYTITAEDRRQGRRIHDSALAPMRWLTGIAEPFSFVALGFGIYCYAIGNRALGLSLFVSFGYLFSKGFLLRLVTIEQGKTFPINLVTNWTAALQK